MYVYVCVRDVCVCVCCISVHHSDHQRMDMVMPGGRHIYLRAASMSERQQWLLSLGVAKQGGVLSDTTGNAALGGVIVDHSLCV